VTSRRPADVLEHAHDEPHRGGYEHDHAHDHDLVDDHPNDHAHPHGAQVIDPERAQLGPSDNGSVVLDIGGDFGALILLAPSSMLLDEIEISPVGRDGARTHVAIRERRGPRGTQWAAIYPRLAAGEYTVWDQRGEPADRVRIDGGFVAQLDWR
jgi:hypothetical protein